MRSACAPPPPGATKITVSGVSKGFGGRMLFEDVDVSFAPGHNYGLTGPNGCGKSTFMKLLIGAESTDRGAISLPERTAWLRQDHTVFDAHRVLDRERTVRDERGEFAKRMPGDERGRFAVSGPVRGVRGRPDGDERRLLEGGLLQRLRRTAPHDVQEPRQRRFGGVEHLARCRALVMQRLAHPDDRGALPGEEGS